MDGEKLQKVILKRPFTPVRITLHAGPTIELRHPEHVWITAGLVLIRRDPEPPIVFEPEMVVSVECVKNGRRRP